MSYDNCSVYLINSGPRPKRDCISIATAIQNSVRINTDLPATTPIYSAYTGNLIAYGSIPNGTICDAPPEFTQNGLPFRVIFCDDTGTYTAYGIG
jgi:hypothetical protein